MPHPRALRILVLISTGAGGALAAESPAASGGAKSSPFMPPAATAQTVAAGDSGENLEFAGISSVGSRTDFIIHDRSTRKSLWLGMGETKNGIALVSHDPRRDVLTINSNGIQKQLPLRKGTSGAGRAAAAPTVVGPASDLSPTATPAVQTPPPPGVPAPGPDPTVAATETKPAPATPAQEAILKQETEARNLVSDLLEIGMAQRRAYEEAQRRNGGANPSETQPVAPKQP